MIVEIGPYTDGDAERIENIQIANYDTWNMDHTLAVIIYPMLIQLKETKHGAPAVDLEDVPPELRMEKTAYTGAPVQYDLFYDDVEKIQEELFFKRWDWVMEEMIFAFASKTVNEDWADQFHSGEFDIYWAPVDEEGNDVDEADAEYHEMRQGPNDTHVWDKEGYMAYQERISNGFRLFGKYYEALWD
jgi:hypothetical protein